MRATRQLFVLVFAIVSPLLASAAELIPAVAPRGADVMLAGPEVDRADVVVAFTSASGATVAAPVLARANGVAELRVPPTAASGPVTVTAGSELLATLSFTLAAEPPYVRVSTLRAASGGTALKRAAGVTLRVTDGRAYVADTLNHRIVAITAMGELQLIGGSGRPGWVDGLASEAEFHAPAGVAYDAARNFIYVADTQNHCIRRIDAAGRVTTLAGSGRPADADGHGSAASFSHPAGLAVDGVGNVYVADTQNHKIRKVTPAGLVTTVAGTGRPSDRDGAALQAGFHAPGGIAISASDAVVVADTGNHVVRKIERGEVVSLAGTRQRGFADGAGHLAQFDSPGGIAVGDGGAVFVADAGNHRIRRIEIDDRGASVSTVAGSGVRGSADGAPLSATFNAPAAVTSASALYVADSGNGVIRVIEPEVRLTDVYPRRGPLPGTAMRLFGTGFVAGRTRAIAGGRNVVLTYVSATQAIAQLPAGDAGAVDVTVVSAGGSATLPDSYVYLAPPTLTLVQPAKSSSSGGQPVTLRGSNFVVGETRVLFGARPLASITATDAVAVNATTSLATALAAHTAPGAHGPADVTVTTPGGTATVAGLFTYFEAPSILGFTPANGSAGTAVTINGANFDAEASGNSVRFGTLAAVVLSGSPTSIVAVVPEGAVPAPIFVTTAGGTARSANDFVTAVLTAIAISPASADIDAGANQQFTATATWSDGRTENVTATAAWSSSNTRVATMAGGLARGVIPGSATITATFGGRSATARLTVRSLEPLPPNPEAVAPPVDTKTVVPLGDSVQFLHTGPDPIQTNVAAGAIDRARAAVVRGIVKTLDGFPLGGAKVTILGRGEFGQTLSRADGMYDLVVNGGETVTVVYERTGYISAQRTITTAWLDFTIVDDVVLVPYDRQSTVVSLGAATPQVVQGSVAQDETGERRAVLLVPSGTTATLELPNGTTQPVSTLTLRATELTVGRLGPAAMPAELPLATGYTYCVELSADEAIAANAKSVRFSRALPLYVDNFIGFPVGTAVPVGYYDRAQAVWVPANNGRVIRITAITAGSADIDITGDGVADSATALSALGIDAAEQRQLATIYAAGKTLWRVTVTHFTPWDLNWPYGPGPDGAQPPQLPDDLGGDSGNQPGTSSSPQSTPVTCPGSVIECENEALGETAPIHGAPLTLHYKSDRVPGRLAATRIELALTGNTMPPGLLRVELDVRFGGQRVTQTYVPAPNLKQAIQWDGRDAYGRLVQGGVEVEASVGYVYRAVYQQPAALAQAFGAFSGVPMTADRQRAEITAWQTIRRKITPPWANEAAGLGGWSISEHHAYDPATRTVYFGSGGRRSVGAERVMERVAGNGGSGFSGDGGAATHAQLKSPVYVATAADGSTYISDYSRIRRVSRDGTIRTIAGSGSCCFIEEGSRALDAQISPAQLTLDRSNRPVFITAFTTSFGGNNRIYRIDGGRIYKVAGRGTEGYSGDGGPATEAFISARDIAYAADGTLYIADSYGLRVVSRDGTIRTIGQVGVREEFLTDRPVNTARLASQAIAIGPDGAIYLSAGATIRRIGADGMVRVIAGAERQKGGNRCPVSDEGATAGCAILFNILDLAVGSDGTIFFSDLWRNRIGKISPAGVVSTVAGNQETREHVTDGAPATGVRLNNFGISLGADDSIYTGMNFSPVVWKARPLTPWFESGGTITIAAADGTEVYDFDGHGRHLRTRGALDGAVRFAFAYDADGRLSGITGPDGRTTRIERDNGAPAAIVAPTGERTTLVVDDHGYLKTITNPAGEKRTYTYSEDGLLLTFTSPRGGVHEYGYDDGGRLRTDTNPAGATTHLTASRSGSSVSATITSPGGRTRYITSSSSRDGSVARTIVDPAGGQTRVVAEASGTTNVTLPSGVQIRSIHTPDPRFGMQAPLASQVTYSAGGKTMTTEHKRTVTLADSSDIFSVQSVTDTVTVNGRAWTMTTDVSSRQLTTRSPLGRQLSASFDADERPTSITLPGLAAISFVRDAQGRLRSAGAGSRTVSFDYDGLDRLVKVTDVAGRSVRLAYDDTGRLATQTLSDGRVVRLGYDAHGNLTSVTPPGRPRHEFTLNAVDLPETYTAPSVGGEATTHYRYDADGALIGITRPDGAALTFGYDSGGRLQSVSAPGASLQYSWNSGSGKLEQAGGGDASVSYGYEGPLLTAATWQGAVSGAVAWAYDNDLRVVSENGTALAYDDDGLLVTAGVLTLRRDAQNGLLTGTTLSQLTDTYQYNQFGEVVAYSASYADTPLLTFTYTRDNAGRITAIGDRAFEYDAAGRLTRIRSGGTTVAEYAYDENGNRTEHKWLGGSNTASYDAQDRVITYGGFSYEHTPNGDLAARTVAGAKTTFDYDELGSLRKVVLAGGTVIEYLVDAQNRRVGKRVAGTTVQGWLYADQLRVVAELDGSSNVRSRFVYGSRTNVPDYMVRDGVTYRILSDHLGSPRLVVNVEDGTVVQRMDFDEFGRVLTDTNPGFQPFGFAGGLYDLDTGLVRFGARDYDPATGRWTAKDPIGFAGGDSNLYAYVSNDPVNLVDPSGLSAGSAALCFLKGAVVGVAGAAVVAGGAAVAGAVGVPTAIVTAAVGAVAVVGAVVLISDVREDVLNGNWDGLAYSAGSLFGSSGAGRATARAVPGVSKTGPFRLWDWDQHWRPVGTMRDWFGTGPTPASAAGSSALAGAGAASAVSSACGC